MHTIMPLHKFTDHCFPKPMKMQNGLVKRKKIAPQVYHELLTSQHDQHKIWYLLRNKAQQMIREGMTREAIIDQLRNEFVVPQKKEKQ